MRRSDLYFVGAMVALSNTNSPTAFVSGLCLFGLYIYYHNLED